MARLHSWGIIPIVMELLNRTDTGNAICAASFFSKLGGSPSEMVLIRVERRDK